MRPEAGLGAADSLFWGGGWDADTYIGRSAVRSNGGLDFSFYDLGFRAVLPPSPQ